MWSFRCSTVFPMMNTQVKFSTEHLWSEIQAFSSFHQNTVYEKILTIIHWFGGARAENVIIRLENRSTTGTHLYTEWLIFTVTVVLGRKQGKLQKKNSKRGSHMSGAKHHKILTNVPVNCHLFSHCSCIGFIQQACKGGPVFDFASRCPGWFHTCTGEQQRSF